MDNAIIKIFDKLDSFIRQRPGIDYADYGGSIAAYRSDCRHAAKYRKPALENLKRLYEQADKLDITTLLEATKGDRLSLVLEASGSYRWEYTAGQYYPTEYREAAYRVTSRILNLLK